MILVTSANGRTGRSVVEALGRVGLRVRAFDLDPEVHGLRDRAATETVAGDLLDTRALLEALDGIETVVHIGPPMHPREVEMGHAVVSATRHVGVQHLVQFSVTHAQLEPLLNHQAKLAVERLVLLSRIPFTILQPMHYMQNIDVCSVVADGVLSQPYSIDSRLAHVDLDDVAAVAAKVVSEGSPHHYATYELCGADFRTARELAEVISTESGRAVTAIQKPLSARRTAGPRPLSEEDDYRADAMYRLFDHYGRYGITGNPNVLSWLLGRRPTTFGEYVRRSLAAT
jgi:uncharacterized protein YbjT (DUF2867 family)